MPSAFRPHLDCCEQLRTNELPYQIKNGTRAVSRRRECFPPPPWLIACYITDTASQATVSSCFHTTQADKYRSKPEFSGIPDLGSPRYVDVSGRSCIRLHQFSYVILTNASYRVLDYLLDPLTVGREHEHVLHYTSPNWL